MWVPALLRVQSIVFPTISSKSGLDAGPGTILKPSMGNSKEFFWLSRTSRRLVEESATTLNCFISKNKMQITNHILLAMKGKK